MDHNFLLFIPAINGMALNQIILFGMIVFSMIIVGTILKIFKVPGKIINIVITIVGLGFGYYWLTTLDK
ncbi:hypothetical protein [Domibacillus epiphyticus]|uniref:Uncharacterized protein n=1 Tax=Domibacillus epiphyticus TaxID=1714355 RepID=A0A1V2A7Q2_9BACI|nr:hypothetical protein [Domibacillus epiphyticus]OMP66960.1 hypothetical protein BTO28_09495 [Domibacillus epiphyticus]